MNAIAEPIELLEAECNAQGWYDTQSEDDYAPVIDEACSERVLGWMVQRICASDFGTMAPRASA